MEPIPRSAAATHVDAAPFRHKGKINWGFVLGPRLHNKVMELCHISGHPLARGDDIHPGSKIPSLLGRYAARLRRSHKDVYCLSA